jgi:hypothetical protein
MLSHICAGMLMTYPPPGSTLLAYSPRRDGRFVDVDGDKPSSASSRPVSSG